MTTIFVLCITGFAIFLYAILDRNLNQKDTLTEGQQLTLLLLGIVMMIFALAIGFIKYEI